MQEGEGALLAPEGGFVPGDAVTCGLPPSDELVQCGLGGFAGLVPQRHLAASLKQRLDAGFEVGTDLVAERRPRLRLLLTGGRGAPFPEHMF